uniref:FBD domain-containing protein n=1 Tax=Lactuca sativa TaxID=4236 RepID=A0A9R1X2C9_LACSA|nr:hypothetical protein LSAT_V11C700352300 [Lactuca sativa]
MIRISRIYGGGGGGEDRISALLNCVLVEILSGLPSTKGAIRTGTLSKRWEHLWTLLPTLIFKQNGDYHDFVSFVDKTLTQRRLLKLKTFEVYTIYDARFESQVRNWIHQYFFTGSCFTDLKLSGCMFNPTGEINWKNLRSLCISDGNLHEDLIRNILFGSP